MTTTSPAARSFSSRAFAGTARRAAFAGAAAALLASGALLATEPAKKPLTFGASPEVARGQYLVAIMGCDDCHTPMKMGPKGPEPDMSRRLSGHPAEFKVPKKILLMDEIPKGATGKLQRIGLAAKLGLA